MKYKILVVDDDKELVKMLCKIGRASCRERV